MSHMNPVLFIQFIYFQVKQNSIENIAHLFPLKSNIFPFKYQSTDGSGTPRGGVQFITTGPPTRATVSFGINLKSSRRSEI